jgi:hypothetical protein
MRKKSMRIVVDADDTRTSTLFSESLPLPIFRRFLGERDILSFSLCACMYPRVYEGVKLLLNADLEKKKRGGQWL